MFSICFKVYSETLKQLSEEFIGNQLLSKMLLWYRKLLLSSFLKEEISETKISPLKKYGNLFDFNPFLSGFNFLTLLLKI